MQYKQKQKVHEKSCACTHTFKYICCTIYFKVFSMHVIVCMYIHVCLLYWIFRIKSQLFKPVTIF